MTDSKNAYEQKWAAQLDEWEADIKKLSAKASKAEAKAAIELNRELEALKSRQRDAGRRLEELRQTGEDAWGEVKDGIEQTRTRMAAAFGAIQQKFD